MQVQPKPPPSSAREQAKQILVRLDELVDAIHDAREEESSNTPPPERVLALIADTRSLAEGISNGAITVSQPRMASNLIDVVELLDHCGHYRLSTSFTGLLEGLSVNGLAAENCTLERSRIGPSKH